MTQRKWGTTGIWLLTVTVMTMAQAKPSPHVMTDAQRAAVEGAARAWVAALNSGQTAEALKGHSHASRAANGDDRLSGQLTRIRETIGPLEFHHAEVVEFARGTQKSRFLHIYAKATRDQRWKDFQIALDPEPPFLFEQIAFVADVSEPVYLPNADLPDPTTRRWLDGYVDRLVSTEGLSGSVLITQGTNVVFSRTFGAADAAGRRPIDRDTRFSMASASKMFTAVLIAKLVEEGRLRYADTIGRYLPSGVMTDAWSTVTIDQLLAHNSGIGEYWTPAFTEARGSVRSLLDFVPWIHKAGQAFPPGTSHRYSNSNYILLGLIVEHVTRRTFEDELQRVILLPIKMSSTSLNADPLPASRDAEPLSRDGRGWKHSGLPGRGSSAGGAWTTVADATTFLRGLATGRLVSPATLATMREVRNQGAAAYPYGYALEMRTDDGATSWGHGGIAAGVNAELRYFPSLDITMVMFSNQDNGAYDDLKKNLIKLITGAR